MLFMPSFKKGLIVEQFQGNYLKWYNHIYGTSYISKNYSWHNESHKQSFKGVFNNFFLYEELGRGGRVGGRVWGI